ncbi:MAG: c-type cytochrome biogenesis protein CcmI [Alphaproteobacteria bacterium]
MIFWIIVGVLSTCVVAGLLLPLLRRPRTSIDRGAYDLTVYRDQLAEIDRDLARGEIGAEQATAARTEVERRLLAIAPAANTAPPRPTAQRMVGVVLAITVPAATVGIYLFLGAPGAPSQPFAKRTTTADAATQAAPAMAQLAERLAARLATVPDDRDSWILLARTYTELQRFAEAAGAYGQAIENGFDGAEMHAARGESLTAAADGTVVPEARQAFATALERDPEEPRARYYAGLALAQDGRVREAMDVWTALLREAPADAPWRAFIATQVRRSASALGEAVPPEAAETAQPQAPAQTAPVISGAPGPSQADVEAAAEMSAADRAAFIRTMVQRLASRMEEEPDNIDGWLRLTRAYGVLGEIENAKEALARAEALIRDLPADAPERAAVKAARTALPASD